MNRRLMLLWSPGRFRLPYRICVPWQPVVAEDGPYKAWRWRGREWFKSPWREGRTRETYMRYAAMYPGVARGERVSFPPQFPDNPDDRPFA